jgi:uncharacterized membrane protein
MSADFNYLKTHFSKTFNSMVREHQAVNKVITFCNDKEQYFLFTGMFNEVNGGKGITEDLEVYFVNYLAEIYDAKAFGRASAYVLEDQTKFIGYDIKGADGSVWSQQNNFESNDEGRVTVVSDEVSASSETNSICPLVSRYFEKIDFPDDTKEFLKNLHAQVTPSFHIIKKSQ